MAMVIIVFSFAASIAGACALVSMTLTPDSGLAGSSFTVESVGGFTDDSYSILWDGTEIAVGMTDSSGNGSLEVTVPTDAVTGEHTVEYMDIGGVKCSAIFTVTGGVAADAYTGLESLTVLPSTGIAAILIIVGLSVLGAGTISWYKRK